MKHRGRDQRGEERRVEERRGEERRTEERRRVIEGKKGEISRITQKN